MKKLVALFFIFISLCFATDYSGTYYVGTTGTRPGGGDPDFLSLKAAFDAVSTVGATFSGDCTFYITSDITEAETGGRGIGIACNPSPYTITFKPYTAIIPTVTLLYPSDGNAGPSGAMLVGINGTTNAWTDYKTTKNIIFDGSNTNGGTTRDLTIQSTGAIRNSFPMCIVCDVSDVMVKNCNIFYKAAAVSTSGSLLVSAVVIRSSLAANTTTEKIPSNLTFDNNFISADFAGVVQRSQGIGTYAAGALTSPTWVTGITMRNNKIAGKCRGISLYYCSGSDIYSNEVILNQDIADGLLNEAIFIPTTTSGSTFNIYNNRISKISSKTSTGTQPIGNVGIDIESGGTYNVYNNMIYGFELTSVNANKSALVCGIRNVASSATANIYHNTIQMENLASIGSGTVSYYGMLLSSGINSVKNNIFVNNEDDFASACISRPNNGTAGVFNQTLTSDYNDFYRSGTTNAQIGFYDASNTADLTAWQTATVTEDSHSKSVAVTFNGTDLHLSGGSNGDVNLTGVSGLGITTDIDGETRSVTFPYMGADEASTPVPVELTSFAAVAKGKNIELKWKTATEVNNHGFEIEKSVNGIWNKIGFVNGAGNSNAPKEYGYVDAVTANGTYSYRLKQIDNNGKFTYNNAIEVNVNAVVSSYELTQNFPNPFNPTTTIRFSVKVLEQTSVKVYDVTGREVAILFNGVASPGQVYNVQFNATGLSSGVYFYVLQSQNFRDVKKMQLLK